MMNVIRELLEETHAEGWTWKNWMACFLQAVYGSLTIVALLWFMMLVLGG
jgi:hypothetical protein